MLGSRRYLVVFLDGAVLTRVSIFRRYLGCCPIRKRNLTVGEAIGGVDEICVERVVIV